MTLTRTSIDRTTLPQSLLVLAKQQMRVDWDDEDRIIVQKLQLAIDVFEKQTDFSVFPATYVWEPGVVLAVDDESGLLPVMRVTQFSAVNDSNVDITAQYAISGMGHPDAITPQYLTGPDNSTTAPVVTVTVGYATADEMPPTIVDWVLRHAAQLFEYRELQAVPGLTGFKDDSFFTHWWRGRA